MWTHIWLAGSMKDWRVFFCSQIDKGYHGMFVFFQSGWITLKTSWSTGSVLLSTFTSRLRSGHVLKASGGWEEGSSGLETCLRASVLRSLMWSQQGRLFSGTSCLLQSRVKMSRLQTSAGFGESCAELRRSILLKWWQNQYREPHDGSKLSEMSQMSSAFLFAGMFRGHAGVSLWSSEWTCCPIKWQ